MRTKTTNPWVAVGFTTWVFNDNGKGFGGIKRHFSRVEDKNFGQVHGAVGIREIIKQLKHDDLE